jgi:hypothetical protein
MFSSSYSERKSKSGVRVVENDALRAQDETLTHTFKNKVSIRIGNEAVDGFLSFTSERLLFSREDDNKEESTWKAFQIYFKSVCVHAIESLVVRASPEEEKKEEKKVGEKCLYLQVEGELDPLIVRNAIERSDEDEEDDSFEEPATEVRIFPLLSDDEEGKEEEEEEEEERMVLEEMFERMNECALLNPDTEDENENDENDDPMFFGANGMVTAETLSFLEEGGGGEYFTSEKAIRKAGFGEKLDEFERKLVISEEDRKRFEDAEE